MWLIYALAASLLWGFDYAFAEQVFKQVSIIGALALTTLAAGLVLGTIALSTGQLQQDIGVLAVQPRILWFLIISAGAFIAGDVLISASIHSHNATVASLVEITYPFFVGIMSYLFFAESTLNIGTLVGGVITFIGVAVVYVFNR